MAGRQFLWFRGLVVRGGLAGRHFLWLRRLVVSGWLASRHLMSLRCLVVGGRLTDRYLLRLGGLVVGLPSRYFVRQNLVLLEEGLVGEGPDGFADKPVDLAFDAFVL